MGKTLTAGVVAGIVATILNFVMHGMMLASEYAEYPEVFSQEGGGEYWFAIIAVITMTITAWLFACSRSAWSEGILAGVKFAAGVGAVVGFTNFYWPIVIEGFPYHLAWCWWGVDLIAYSISGAVLGAMIKKS